MLGVILSAVFVIMLGYLMVGISGYLAFPTSVQGNILKSFPADDILMQACTHPPPLHRILLALHARARQRRLPLWCPD